MKSIWSICILCMFELCSNKNSTVFSTHFKHVDSLIQAKMFFAARDYLQAYKSACTPLDVLVAGALVDDAFNRPADAVSKIETVLKTYTTDLEDSIKLKLMNVLQMNYGKLGDYRQAHQYTSTMIRDYPSICTREQIDGYKNMNKIWKSLSGYSPQVITPHQEVYIKLKRDKLGLKNLPVSNGTQDFDFIFDTGANFSTISETAARKWNLTLSDSIIQVSSITGNKVAAHISVCENLFIHDIVCQNVVFIIFPDSALYIPQVPYQINGILGFPIFNALGEIQITKQDEFIVPRIPTLSKIRNMALDFLNPVIELGGDSYTFDSGADETLLYKKYYDKYKNKIDTAYQLKELTLSGVGGGHAKKGFVIDFETIVNDERVQLDSVELYMDPIKASGDFYFGNIGQDLISRFNTMILNFKDMFILFK